MLYFSVWGSDQHSDPTITLPLEYHPRGSASGGVAFYVKSNLDYIIRDVSNALEDEFETTWVQIKSNIIYLDSYRDPNTEIEKFYQHIDRILTKSIYRKQTCVLHGISV